MNVQKFQATAGVHICTMLFGLSAVLAQGLQTPASAIVAGRAVWAVLTLSLVLLCLSGRHWRSLSGRSLFHYGLNGVLLAGHWLCFFTGVEQGGVAVGTLGFACFPVFVSLLGRVLFATPISGRNLIAMLLVATGLYIISPSVGQGQYAVSALLWAVAAGLSYAIIVLYNNHIDTGGSPLVSAWFQCLTCAVVTLPWGYSALTESEGGDFFHILLIGVLCTGLAYSLLTFALRKVNASKAAIIISLEPLWAIVFAAMLSRVLPDNHTLFGGSFILAAVMLSALPQTTSRQSNSRLS